MLEGIEQENQHNEILRAAKKFRQQLEKTLFSECLKFEKETGLIIKSLEVLRASPNPAMPYKESESVLFGINVDVGL